MDLDRQITDRRIGDLGRDCLLCDQRGHANGAVLWDLG